MFVPNTARAAIPNTTKSVSVLLKFTFINYFTQQGNYGQANMYLPVRGYQRIAFLAHLAERPSELFSSLGVVVVVRRRRPALTFTKIFSSETTGPNLTKLGHNHHWGI